MLVQRPLSSVLGLKIEPVHYHSEIVAGMKQRAKFLNQTVLLLMPMGLQRENCLELIVAVAAVREFQACFQTDFLHQWPRKRTAAEELAVAGLVGRKYLSMAAAAAAEVVQIGWSWVGIVRTKVAVVAAAAAVVVDRTRSPLHQNLSKVALYFVPQICLSSQVDS